MNDLFTLIDFYAIKQMRARSLKRIRNSLIWQWASLVMVALIGIVAALAAHNGELVLVIVNLLLMGLWTASFYLHGKLARMDRQIVKRCDEIIARVRAHESRSRNR